VLSAKEDVVWGRIKEFFVEAEGCGEVVVAGFF